jgi:hypothetical protein
MQTQTMHQPRSDLKKSQLRTTSLVPTRLAKNTTKFDELAQGLLAMEVRADNRLDRFVLTATTWVQMASAIYLVKCLAVVADATITVLAHNVGLRSRLQSRLTSPMPHMVLLLHCISLQKRSVRRVTAAVLERVLLLNNVRSVVGVVLLKTTKDLLHFHHHVHVVMAEQ